MFQFSFIYDDIFVYRKIIGISETILHVGCRGRCLVFIKVKCGFRDPACSLRRIGKCQTDNCLVALCYKSSMTCDGCSSVTCYNIECFTTRVRDLTV